MQDHGLRVLHRALSNSHITIKVLDLRNNGLTISSASSISDLIIHCKVEVLGISNNHTIGEEPTLYNILSLPLSRLVELYMIGTRLTSRSSTIVLFTALGKGNKLQRLNISINLITDEACDFIAISFKNNTSLVELQMYGNKISAEAAQCLIHALCCNYTLQWLWLPVYPEDVKMKIRFVQEEIIKKRESRGCQTKLKFD